MKQQGSQYWVDTSFFKVEPGEDSETNPGRFGRAMARWLAAKFVERGQTVEDVFGEDWGWCVLLSRRPYSLWVGCGNRFGSTSEWGAFVEAEAPLLRRMRYSAEMRLATERLEKLLEEILSGVPDSTGLRKEDPPGG